MQVILEVDDSREQFFKELVESLEFVKLLKEIKGKEKNRAVQDLIEAFDEARQHEQGKKHLKSARELLDEL